MKKPIVLTISGSALALSLLLASGFANAEREAVRDAGGNVQEGVVEHPVADAEAIRIHRDNLDYDNDGTINANDPDDDNDGIADADDPDDDNDGTPDTQDTN